jgi:hypothetical protein
MVINQKTIESEIGYRGSKSTFLKYVEKEQRVDGSYTITLLRCISLVLRCTLTGFERNYQIRILSKQLILHYTLRTLSFISCYFPNPFFLQSFKLKQVPGSILGHLYFRTLTLRQEVLTEFTKVKNDYYVNYSGTLPCRTSGIPSSELVKGRRFVATLLNNKTLNP